MTSTCKEHEHVEKNTQQRLSLRSEQCLFYPPNLPASAGINQKLWDDALLQMLPDPSNMVVFNLTFFTRLMTCDW